MEHHTKIFASMCPDEILDYYDDYDTREYHTTLMLGDVSGFTELTEKYTKTGRGGASKLTETLNTYIGAMVQEILSHNGDVLKFSGDAFIVMWKLQEGMIMRDIALEALQTACIIQTHFGTFDTDVGVTLRVKLAIASGKTYFTSIGDAQTMSHYLITGKPVWDVKIAEALCRGGDILVAPSSWQWANPNEYVHEMLPDGIHTLITACSSMWYQTRAYDISNDIKNEKDTKRYDEDIDSDSSDEMPDTEAEAVFMNLTGDTLEVHRFNDVDYSLRPKIIQAAKIQLKDALRSYMLRPVIRSVEMDEPLEHLTEMRQVVILFINVITTDIEKKKLILLVNEAYKIVCGRIREMQGCVNKASLFDKDLIFLCIFGLRGDKHELESQIGLRCASKVRQDLLAMKNIKSVTIGVTTGITYCGVVGHILRREYTVIGMTVNKAARLMCAYNNKVICDRESFLRSRLESRHFILQEPRFLKGITNVGPVYEFQEQMKYDISELTWRKYPLLGRQAEIKIFQQILTNLVELYHKTLDKTAEYSKPKYNTLIIKGEPRIGKTRLLDEIMQNIPKGIFSNYISLIADDAKVPYNLIHLIFSMPLGLTVATTSKEREDKLISRLGRVRQPEFLCVLNVLFNVRFTISASYKELSKARKRKMLHKFLLKLMRGCFGKLWVMIIDNAEYSDNESMKLFHTMTKQDTVFFILTIGRKLNVKHELNFENLERARIIELSHIDKWYHAALACQILNVCGITAELEKLIQERSFGNPGWIESYLVSFIQSGGLVIMSIRKTKAEELGYVLPPISMLKRIANAQDILTNMNNENNEEYADRWQMYRASFRENAISLLNAQGVMPIEVAEIDSEDRIAVCTFAEDFVPEEEYSELTMDVMILKLFDSLTPLDQALLKCASVLGETVNRKMLHSLLEEEMSMREIGLDELSDLPRYASCGMMHFKMSMFRETTYRLLTENQKMELHSKALKYLQQHTRRCVACGELQFVKLLGLTPVQEVKMRKSIVEKLIDIERYGQAEIILEDEVKNDVEHLVEDRHRKLKCLDIFRNISKKPTKTFSHVDFANCQCNLILTSVYTQIVEHCHGIGKNEMTLKAILEFVEICLVDCNIPQASRLLSEAEVLLHEMFEPKEEEPIILPYLTGKIQTLQGKCFLESGLIIEAKKKLDQAMSTLGYTFPRHEFFIDLKSTIQLESLKWKLTCPKNWKINDVDELTTNYIEQLANCLAQMFEVFRIRGLKKHARLAAIWSLNAVLDTSRDFFTLCTLFANMMITAHVYQNKSIIPYLENEALSFCAEKKSSLEFQELKAIAEVYSGVFLSRWVRGEISKAIKIGFVVSRMAHTINYISLKLHVLPRLAHLLIVSCRHSEVIALVRELEFISQDDLDKSGRTWYYAICADIQLDTGLTVLSFQKCEQYYLREGETMISLRDPEAERRYFTSMWLWCIRTQQWEASKVWSSRNVTPESVIDEYAIAATFTALKKLEGLLLLYVREVSGRNISAIHTKSEIKDTFAHVEKMIKTVKIAIPRYLLLKAYYYMIQSRKRAAMKTLRETKKLSMKVENKMIYTWANHCEQAWLGDMSSIHKNLWKERLSPKINNGWEEINANDSTIVPFTFPLPRYIL